MQPMLSCKTVQLQHERAELHDRARMAQRVAGELLTDLNVSQHSARAPALEALALTWRSVPYTRLLQPCGNSRQLVVVAAQCSRTPGAQPPSAALQQQQLAVFRSSLLAAAPLLQLAGDNASSCEQQQSHVAAVFTAAVCSSSSHAGGRLVVAAVVVGGVVVGVGGLV